MIDRRECLRYGFGLTFGSRWSPAIAGADAGATPRAIAFDAFPIFDPRPVDALVETLFPGRGAEFAKAWRFRQFEYCWLRVVEGRYADFMHVTDDALVFTAKAMKLELSRDARDKLLGAYLAMGAWPDVASALKQLQSAGIRLAILSNFTPGMLDGCVRAAGLDGIFEHVLSTDAARSYKPDPRAYQLGTDAFGLPRDDILFVPFAGWDAAGAKSFGYPTFWVNRLGSPPEELGTLPDAAGAGLLDLVRYVAPTAASARGSSRGPGGR